MRKLPKVFRVTSYKTAEDKKNKTNGTIRYQCFKDLKDLKDQIIDTHYDAEEVEVTLDYGYSVAIDNSTRRCHIAGGSSPIGIQEAIEKGIAKIIGKDAADG